MRDVELLIAGRLLPARGGMTFERHNPVSGALVSSAAAARLDDARDAADAAAAAFPDWSGLNPGVRRAKLNNAFTELRWITLQAGPRHYPF